MKEHYIIDLYYIISYFDNNRGLAACNHETVSYENEYTEQIWQIASLIKRASANWLSENIESCIRYHLNSCQFLIIDLIRTIALELELARARISLSILSQYYDT